MTARKYTVQCIDTSNTGTIWQGTMTIQTKADGHADIDRIKQVARQRCARAWDRGTKSKADVSQIKVLMIYQGSVNDIYIDHDFT